MTVVRISLSITNHENDLHRPGIEPGSHVQQSYAVSIEQTGKYFQIMFNLMQHTCIYEPRHDKTNIVRLRPAWIQTSLRIRVV
jgi:hypothetical protein